eukprot:6183998-Pleurochrysis_carterae.AAC.3
MSKLVRVSLVLRASASAVKPATRILSQPEREGGLHQHDAQTMNVNSHAAQDVCNVNKRAITLLMKTAMRTRQVQARVAHSVVYIVFATTKFLRERNVCENVVELEAVSQRRPALVADTVAVCACGQLVRHCATAREPGFACNASQAQHKHAQPRVRGTLMRQRERRVPERSRLVRVWLILRTSAIAMQPLSRIPVHTASSHLTRCVAERVGAEHATQAKRNANPPADQQEVDDAYLQG